ncbi:hypothetical protein BGZ82_000985 [Podila clonocystis]|nr:hypothetical protein BGZ82_000985 [Podila clonocystis]
MSLSPPCPPTSQKTQDGLAMLLGQAISESPQTQMTIWTLQLNAPQSNGPLVPAKRKTTEPTNSGISTNTTTMKSIDTTSTPITTSTTITPMHDIVEDTPSPSPEDTQPRRSGRSRRPPKPKEADDYITHSIHVTSRRHASPTTPPTSPPPNKESEDPPPIKKRGSVKFDKHITTTIPSKEHTTIDTAMRTPVEEPVMTHRLRRPPQNLSEFVSSEDFKAAPCGKRMDRAFTACGQTTPSSSLSPVAIDDGTRSVRADRKDKKRSKSESNVSNAASHILTATSSTTTLASATPPPTQTNSSAMSTKPTMGATSTEALELQPSGAKNINPRPRPVSIPLSALSHSKRRSEDFSTCFQRPGEVKKRQRRSQSVQLQSMTLDHHQRRDFPSRHEIYEQRRQYRLQRSKHGKRGGSGDDEEDSDSDFDFLKEEEENYRMRILTAKRQLALTGRLGRLYESGDEYEDEVDEDEVYLRERDDHEGGRRKTFARSRDQKCEEAHEEGGSKGRGYGKEYERSCRAEGERIKLLMDPSVITYGFDSCDGQYILDYNQSPLFNNVTWPEFSDLKDLKDLKGINPNHGGNDGCGQSQTVISLSDQNALETHFSTTESSLDPALKATNKDGVSLALSSAFLVLAECGTEVEFTSTDFKSCHPESDVEAKEWGLFMGQGGGRPSIEGNKVMDRRLERQLSLSSLFSLLSAKQEPLKLIPEIDTEMSLADTENLVKLSEDILEGVASEAELLSGTGCKAEDVPKAGREMEEEDGQVEEFIGLSWCQ